MTQINERDQRICVDLQWCNASRFPYFVAESLRGISSLDRHAAKMIGTMPYETNRQAASL